VSGPEESARTKQFSFPRVVLTAGLDLDISRDGEPTASGEPKLTSTPVKEPYLVKISPISSAGGSQNIQPRTPGADTSLEGEEEVISVYPFRRAGKEEETPPTERPAPVVTTAPHPLRFTAAAPQKKKKTKPLVPSPAVAAAPKGKQRATPPLLPPVLPTAGAPRKGTPKLRTVETQTPVRIDGIVIVPGVSITVKLPSQNIHQDITVKIEGPIGPIISPTAQWRILDSPRGIGLPRVVPVPAADAERAEEPQPDAVGRDQPQPDAVGSDQPEISHEQPGGQVDSEGSRDGSHEKDATPEISHEQPGGQVDSEGSSDGSHEKEQLQADDAKK